jgi:hypothetical protein
LVIQFFSALCTLSALAYNIVAEVMIMTYRGIVKGGVVIVEGPETPPEGAVVTVNVIEPAASDHKSAPPTWAEVFKDVIGKAKGLPGDSSVNHDHYLYGTPKRE